MAGTSIITLPWILLWILCLWMLVGKDMPLVWLRQSPVSLFVCAACLAGLGAYYYWTLLQHFSTSRGLNTPVSVMFAFYEHLGFSGLGPGRNRLRESPLALTQLPYRLLLAGHVLILAAFCTLLFLRRPAQFWRNHRTVLIVVLLVVPVAIVFAMGVVNQTRILGRHIAPLALLTSVVLAWGSVHLWRSGGVLARLVAVLPFASLALSCSMLRLSDVHQKDDYRSASRVARAVVARGDRVLWAADAASAAYYGLLSSRQDNVSFTRNADTADYRLVVLSRPDLYDPNGTLLSWLNNHKYMQVGHFESFTLWERP
jgi:hypothetical protein